MMSILGAQMKRLRPRDGTPRDIIERVSQFAYRWRIEFWSFATIAACCATIGFWVTS